jgi:CheY-like chemotaxis protein
VLLFVMRSASVFKTACLICRSRPAAPVARDQPRLSRFSLREMPAAMELRYIPRRMTKPPALDLGTPLGPQLPRRKLRILVADDNRDVVLTLMMLLRDDGHEVRGVYDGLDALKAARLLRFDVIILDIEMPALSGYALAQELRAHYHGSRAPLLIAITGKWNRASEKLLAQVVGFDHHLSKPCDPNTLIALIRPLTVASAQQWS